MSSGKDCTNRSESRPNPSEYDSVLFGKHSDRLVLIHRAAFYRTLWYNDGCEYLFGIFQFHLYPQYNVSNTHGK